MPAFKEFKKLVFEASRGRSRQSDSLDTIIELMKKNNIDVSYQAFRDSIKTWLKGPKEKQDGKSTYTEKNKQRILRFLDKEGNSNPTESEMIAKAAPFVLKDVYEKDMVALARGDGGHKSKQKMIDKFKGEHEEKARQIRKSIQSTIDELDNIRGENSTRFVKLVYSMVRKKFKRYNLQPSEWAGEIDDLARYFANVFSRVVAHLYTSTALKVLDGVSDDDDTFDVKTVMKFFVKYNEGHAIPSNVGRKLYGYVKRNMEAFLKENTSLDNALSAIYSSIQTDVESFYSGAWSNANAHLSALDREYIEFLAEIFEADPDDLGPGIRDLAKEIASSNMESRSKFDFWKKLYRRLKGKLVKKD